MDENSGCGLTVLFALIFAGIVLALFIVDDRLEKLEAIHSAELARNEEAPK